MSSPNPSDVTQILSSVESGDAEALDQLLQVVYSELRAICEKQLRAERPEHTLQPTALVHEAYLRLVEQRNTHWKNRAHFFSVASRIIRRILVDHARARLSEKRGQGAKAETFSETLISAGDRNVDLLDLDAALNKLNEEDEEAARVVEMRFFGELTQAEIAHVMNCSERSIQRHWSYAKAWLFRELEEHHPAG